MILTPRLILVVAGVVQATLATGFLLVPHAGARQLDTVLASATALSNFRSVQGGLQLGVGVFLLLGVLLQELRRAALIAQLCLFGGFVLGRLISLFVDGIPRPLTILLLLLELIAVGLAGLGIHRSRGADRR